MSDLDALARLVPPPDDPPPPPDWGQELPSDYRALVERYGPGTLAGLVILTPGHANRYADLDRQTGELRGILKTLRERGIEPRYEPDALLPWGVDESGNVVWWLTTGDPDRWPVVANEARGDEWQRFDGGAVAFLLALLSGRERSAFLVVEGDDFEPL
jgi:hypothetical protein